MGLLQANCRYYYTMIWSSITQWKCVNLIINNSLILFPTQVKYLSGLGGFGPKAVIKNIMQKVLTDDLAKEFNWQGRVGKRPFSRLGLADIIKGNISASETPHTF